MKKNLLLIFTILISFGSFGQVYQRMAIPKGVYKLKAKGSFNSSKDFAAYCVDFTRKAPNTGVNYINHLEGAAEVVFEGTQQILSLTDAMKSGKVSIVGTKWDSIHDLIKSLPKSDYYDLKKALDVEYDLALNQFRSMPDYQSLNALERAQMERRLKRYYSVSSYFQRNWANYENSGNWAQLRFINNSDEAISIRASSNVQFGTESETVARKGLEDFDFKGGNYGEQDIQNRVWIEQTKLDIDELKTIGEFDDIIPSDDAMLDDAKDIIKNFQSRHGLNPTGELGPSERQKIQELETLYKEDIRLFIDNPNEKSSLKELIDIFQMENKLEVDSYLNEVTRNQIYLKKDELQQLLERTLHNSQSMPLKQAINEYNLIKGRNGMSSVADEDFFKVLRNDKNFYVKIDGDYQPFYLEKISIRAADGAVKSNDYINIIPNSRIFIENGDDAPKLISQLNAELSSTIQQNDIKILYMSKYKNRSELKRSNDLVLDSLRRILPKGVLKVIFNKNKKQIESSLKKVHKKNKGRTMIPIGHIEKGKISSKADMNNAINIDYFGELAKRYNNNYFVGGCSSSYYNVPGTSDLINDLNLGVAIAKGLDNPSSVGEFFKYVSNSPINAGGNEVKLIFNKDSFNNTNRVSSELYVKPANFWQKLVDLILIKQ